MVIPLISMNQLLFEYRLLLLGALHCAVGLTATAIAYRKGYPLKRWLVLGLIGGTPSLVYALTRPKVVPEKQKND